MPATLPPFLRLHRDDVIVVARRRADAGECWSDGNGCTVAARQPVEMGHKLAIRPVAAGEAVRKYGQVIGFATQDIAAGEWVHVHNLDRGQLHLNCEFSTAIPAPPTPITDRTFQGYLRPDGRAATRNYIGIISTVNCSATSSK